MVGTADTGASSLPPPLRRLTRRRPAPKVPDMPRSTDSRKPSYPSTFALPERECTILYPVIRVRQSFAVPFTGGA